jgi:integrase
MANMRRNKSGLPKYCSFNADHHGRVRIRFRKNGLSVYLTGTPWSEDFMRQYAEALDGVKAQQTEIGAKRTKPGSFDALCVSYYRSHDFLNLKDITKADRRGIIENFRKLHGDKPVAKLQRAHVKDIVAAKANIFDGRANTPTAANSLLKVLRLLLNYAVSIDMIAANPAIGVKPYRVRSEGFHAWSEDEIAKFEARHPVGTKARLALGLLLYTAQRRSDVVAMGWQHVVGDAIKVKQAKTGTQLAIPIHPELRLILAATERSGLMFLMSERGARFSAHGFGNWFKEQCRVAGVPHCSAHGLRKSAATRLANAGCTSDQIKAITGHKSLAEVAHYTRTADQQRLARQALELQLGAEGERGLSNLSARLDKGGKK